MTIYTVEIEAHTGAGGVARFYAASGAFNTGPDDNPAHQHFHPSLQVPANVERALFSTGSTTGAPEIGFGEIVLANAHGRYDAWADYAFDGRPCIVKAIRTDPATQRPLSTYRDAAVLLRGTVESLDITDAYRKIRLRFYDPLSRLDQPLQTARYGGTTAAGGQGADGTADLKDTPKPRVYGRISGIVPIDVNPFDLIRQVSDRPCASITVYDGGLSLTNAGDFASVQALAAASLVPGQYATCRALGLFRLGGTPAFAVTADVAAAGGASASEIAKAMLLDFGLTVAEIDAASFDALRAKNAAVCGYLVSGEQTALAAVSDVLRSVGGWIVPDGAGVYHVGRLEAPAGAPIAQFAEWQVRGDLERLAPADANRGIPAFRAVVRYGRIGRALSDNEIAGGVDPVRRAALTLEWRQAVAEDASIKARHLMAQEMVFETCLQDQAAAAAEAARLLAIYGERRDIWRIRVDITNLDYRTDRTDGDPFAMAIGLGSLVTLSAARFLTPPKIFLVIGRVEDTVNNAIQFDLWG